jgi:hypothetical protein
MEKGKFRGLMSKGSFSISFMKYKIMSSINHRDVIVKSPSERIGNLGYILEA